MFYFKHRNCDNQVLGFVLLKKSLYLFHGGYIYPSLSEDINHRVTRNFLLLFILLLFSLAFPPFCLFCSLSFMQNSLWVIFPCALSLNSVSPARVWWMWLLGSVSPLKANVSTGDVWWYLKTSLIVVIGWGVLLVSGVQRPEMLLYIPWHRGQLLNRELICTSVSGATVDKP